MGFLASSASICYFQVSGTFDPATKRKDLPEQLEADGFCSIENSAEELSIGWVRINDYDSCDFTADDFCWRDHYLCFSLRQDRRRVPAALLKREVARLSDQYLADKPTLKYVPKNEKENIRDTARSLLLVRTLPSPSCYDVVWDTERQMIRFCALSQTVIDSFQSLFQQSFPGLSLALIHPLARATEILPQDFQEPLKEANQAQTDSALEQIEANRWLGNDFLLWLFYRTLNSDSGYKITCDGPLLDNQPFTAYIDNRLLLVGGGQEGIQKIVVAGPQDQYQEVKTALAQGKQVEEATIFFLQGEENGWKLTLKGERFQFGGYKTPMIKPEQDPSDNPEIEAQAAFMTKLRSVEEGEQMLNSLLKTFLELRLGKTWASEYGAMQNWLTE
jgi:hypothetical protein